MGDVFISYARPDEFFAAQVGDALRNAGFSVWRDDLLPAHRAYAEVIEERLRQSMAVLVIWSDAAAHSEWVRSEANRAREGKKLIQLTVDGGIPPMPFDQVQCADLRGWTGDVEVPGWRKILASLDELAQGKPTSPSVTALPDEPGSRPPLPQPLAKSGPIFGRAHEFEVLEQAWRAASKNAGNVVLLGGEPGIGKTSLAAAIARRAYEEGATVLFGSCDEDVRFPFRPFAEALPLYVAHASGAALRLHAASHKNALTRLVPALCKRLPGLGEARGSDGEAERFLLFEAVVGLLRQAADEAPVVLVLDDLQWSSGSDLQLLKHVVRATPSFRLLIIGTFRESDIDSSHALTSVLADLRREPAVQRISLGGLDEAAIGEFVAARGETVGLARTLFQETAGNPFFIGEMIHHRAELGLTGTRQDAPAEMLVPDGVREVVERRLGRLSDATARILGIAAIVGRQFDLSLIGDVAGEGVSEYDVLDALDEAESAALVTEVQGQADCYRFSHALVRTTLYEGHSAARRLRMHRRIGEALERHAGGRMDALIDALAYQWSACADAASAAKAIDYLARAGELAEAGLAYEAAVAHYDRALRLVDSFLPEDLERRCDLLLARGGAQRDAGDTGFRATMAEASEHARSIGDPLRLARAALGSGHINGLQWGNGVETDLVERYDEALTALGDREDMLRARLMGQLAVELRYGPEEARRDALSTEAIVLARTAGDATTLGRVLSSRIRVIESPFSLNERLVLTRELEDIAAETGNLEVAAQAAHLRFDVLLQAGDIDGAEQALVRCQRAADQLRAPFFALFPQTLHTLLALMRGDADAEALALQGFQAMSAVGLAHAPNMYGGRMFELATRRGALANMIDQVRMAATVFPAVTSFRSALIFALTETGQHEEARSLMDAFAEIGFAMHHDLSWASAVHMISEAAYALGDIRVADALYPSVEEVADQIGMSVGVKVDGALGHAAGLLAALLGRHDEAVQHFEQAIALNDRIGARPAAVATRRAFSEVLIARGEHTAATPLIEAALPEARVLGLVAEAAKLTALVERVPASALA